MRAEDLLEWQRAVPFKPFRLFLGSGRVYEIRHPEMLRVGRSTIYVFSFRGDPASEPHEHVEMLSLLLVERIEPIESPAHA